jgi:quercetin dioxygenase-like cupin family protein
MSKADWVFNRNDATQGIARQLAEGLSARVFVGDNSTLSIVRIEPHSQGKIHGHPEEQWGVLLEGECIRIQGEEEVSVKVGDFWHTPGNVPHGIRTQEQGAVVLDIFSPPRPEYRSTDKGFGNASEPAQAMAADRIRTECNTCYNATGTGDGIGE